MIGSAIEKKINTSSFKRTVAAGALRIATFLTLATPTAGVYVYNLELGDNQYPQTYIGNTLPESFQNHLADKSLGTNLNPGEVIIELERQAEKWSNYLNGYQVDSADLANKPKRLRLLLDAEFRRGAQVSFNTMDQASLIFSRDNTPIETDIEFLTFGTRETTYLRSRLNFSATTDANLRSLLLQARSTQDQERVNKLLEIAKYLTGTEFGEYNWEYAQVPRPYYPEYADDGVLGWNQDRSAKISINVLGDAMIESQRQASFYKKAVNKVLNFLQKPLAGKFRGIYD